MKNGNEEINVLSNEMIYSQHDMRFCFAERRKTITVCCSSVLWRQFLVFDEQTNETKNSKTKHLA